MAGANGIEPKERGMRRIFVRMGCLMLLGLCTVVSATLGPRSWATMLLSGYVDIGPDGSVRDYAMDHPEKIPPAVLGVIRQAVSGWRFKVNMTGKVIARARMSLRMVARPLGRMKYSVGVEGVQFAGDTATPATLRFERKTPAPRYPRDALGLRTAANVYVLVRIGRDGHVVDAGAEQVNFTLDCPSTSRAGLENQFAMASVRAVRQWTFRTQQRTGSQRPILGCARSGEVCPEMGRWTVAVQRIRGVADLSARCPSRLALAEKQKPGRLRTRRDPGWPTQPARWSGAARQCNKIDREIGTEEVKASYLPPYPLLLSPKKRTRPMHGSWPGTWRRLRRAGNHRLSRGQPGC